MDREQKIIRTSILGIGVNLILVAFKAVVGFISGSIAIILDAVNNLSDALSSVITIIGTKLANRAPDRKHPYGHGRIEYLAGVLIAVLVLVAGLTSLKESIEKILDPTQADYSAASLVIIVAAIIAKLLMGRYVKGVGEKINASTLVASGSDALFDAVLSSSVLLCALLFLFAGLSLEAYVGAVISGFIIKSGIEMMIETLNEILGMRADKETTDRIKHLLAEEPEVRGAFDLILHNYGPNKDLASVHLELPDTMTVREVDRLTRRVESKIYRETGVILTGVGVYSFNTEDEETSRIQNEVRRIVLSHDWAVQFHGFYVDTEEKHMSFDAVMSFEIPAREGLQILQQEVSAAFPDYTVEITPDVDVSVTEL